MKKFFLYLCLAGLCLLAGCSRQATEGSFIYVAVNGNEKASGSRKNPYHSIRQAINKAQPGDTIFLRSGTYDEKIRLNVSGKKNKLIKIRNYKAEKVIIDGSSQQVDGDMEGLLTIKDQHHLQVEGLTFQNFVSDNEKVPVGILIEGKSHHLTVRNCKIRQIRTLNPEAAEANAHALAVYGSDGENAVHDLEIIANEISENKLGLSETLVLNGNVENFRIAENKIFKNDNIGIDLIGYEKTAPHNDRVRNGICEYNQLWDISTVKNPSYEEASAAAIYTDGGKNIIIQQNKIRRSDIGIEAASEHRKGEVTDILIRNNLVADCKEIAGIAFGGYDKKRGHASKIEILNNTLVNNPVHILVQEHAQDVSNQVKNNIFYQGRDFSGQLDKIIKTPNFSGDPQFVNEKQQDYRLKKSSKAVNSAKVTDRIGKKDLAGKPRIDRGKVNFGAYQ